MRNKNHLSFYNRRLKTVNELRLSNSGSRHDLITKVITEQLQLASEN